MSQSALHDFMQTQPDSTLESISERFSTNLLTVITHLPVHTIVPGAQFDTVWQQVNSWGKVTALVHTADVVFEFTGDLPAGSYGRGYFNFHGDKGFGGHIKAQHCQHIAFIERQFMGKDTASIVFLNQQGNAMLKIFPSRDEKRRMLTAQLDAFRALAASLAEEKL